MLVFTEGLEGSLVAIPLKHLMLWAVDLARRPVGKFTECCIASAIHSFKK